MGLRFGLFLLHGVQRQLFDSATLQELLGLVATRVGGALRHEDDVQTTFLNAWYQWTGPDANVLSAFPLDLPAL